MHCSNHIGYDMTKISILHRLIVLYSALLLFLIQMMVALSHWNKTQVILVKLKLYG